MYKEVWFDSELSLKSSTLYPNTDTPVFEFPKGFEGATKIKVIEAIIPKTWNNTFSASNLSIVNNTPVDWQTPIDLVPQYAPHGHQAWRITFQYVNITTRTFYINIPHGAGTTQQIVNYISGTVFGTGFAAFKAQMDPILSPRTLTSAAISINADGLVEWNFVTTAFPGGVQTAFHIRPDFSTTSFPSTVYGENHLWRALGLKPGKNSFRTTTTTHRLVSTYLPTDTPFDYLTIQSSAIGENFSSTPNVFSTPDQVYNYNLNTDFRNCLCHVPSIEPYKGITYYRDANPDSKFTVVNNFQGQLDLFVTLGPFINDPLNFNGSSFKVKIAFESIESDIVSNNNYYNPVKYNEPKQKRKKLTKK
jgi:hypothetical protein